MPAITNPAPAVRTVPIYTGSDFYVPSFKVVLRNRELREELRDIMSVSYSDSLDKIDSFEMSVNNWDAETRDFKYSDANTFDPLQNIELWMGYYAGGRDERQRMLTGEITTLTPNFPGSGGPTLSVAGLNLLQRFRSAQFAYNFLNQKDTQIAQVLIEQIAKEVRSQAPNVRLELDADETEANLKVEQPIESLLIPNIPPIDFLMRRARFIGYELFLEEKPKGNTRLVTVHYRPLQKASRPNYLLEWGKSLLSFQPSLQTARQVSEVTVRGWNPKTKSEITKTATRKDLGDQKVVFLSDLGVKDDGINHKHEIIVDKPIRSEPEAMDFAKQALRQLTQDLVEAKGRVIGRPELRAGSKVEIQGAGRRFSGTYLITATTHSIGDGGYTTDFTGRMEKP